MNVDKSESILLTKLVKQCQGLPISLVQNKPFHLTLADLLWIDPEKESSFLNTITDRKKSNVSNTSTSSLSSSSSSSSSSSFSLDTCTFYFSEQDYQALSLLPPFVPSSPLEIDIQPNVQTTTTSAKLNPPPSTTESQLPSSSSPSTSTSASNINSTQKVNHPSSISPSLIPAPSISTSTLPSLHDPRLSSRITSSVSTTNIKPPLECPSPPASSNGSPSTSDLSSTPPLLNSSLHPLSLPNSLHPKFVSGTSTAFPSSHSVRPSIDQLYSMYQTNTKEPAFPKFYTKLSEKEHKLYLELEKKTKVSHLSEEEKTVFETLHPRVEKEQEEYINYIKSILLQCSARYLTLNEPVKSIMLEYLSIQQRRRSIYPPLYISKKAWKPLDLYKELQKASVSIQELGIQKRMLHAPVNLDRIKTSPLPFNFRPDFTKQLPPMSKDPTMAKLIPHLPDVQFMLTSGTLSKLVRLSHDFHTTGITKLDLLFPITVHHNVVCVDKPFNNTSVAPREMVQKYFSMALRQSSNHCAPPSCQFVTYRLGPYHLLVRTQLDAPGVRHKCNMEYVSELGLEALDQNVLAGYTLKRALGVHVDVVRVHATTGAILTSTPTPPAVNMYLPFLQELFQFLLTLTEGHYILASRPGDTYVYVLQQPAKPDTATHLDLRSHTAPLVNTVPMIRMLEWTPPNAASSAHIPYTFHFPPKLGVQKPTPHVVMAGAKAGVNPHSSSFHPRQGNMRNHRRKMCPPPSRVVAAEGSGGPVKGNGSGNGGGVRGKRKWKNGKSFKQGKKFHPKKKAGTVEASTTDEVAPN